MQRIQVQWFRWPGHRLAYRPRREVSDIRRVQDEEYGTDAGNRDVYKRGRYRQVSCTAEGKVVSQVDGSQR